MPEIIGAAKQAGGALAQPLWFDMPIGFWAALFLFIGACGKSAQIPLYVWLPDAMAGPTPVSALIHAATMVTAGVYMVARLSAVYVLIDPAALAIVALVGAATALFAAIIGFAQNDFKKVLAYSTVSQLGFMFVGVGTGAFAPAIFHLYTHAFFKAGLFLCAGSVMHAMSGSGDITKMGGLRKYLPITHGVFFVCWLAICGVPLVLGLLLQGRHRRRGVRHAPASTQGLAWVGPVVGAHAADRRAGHGLLHVAAVLPGVHRRGAGRRAHPGAHPRVAGGDDRAAGGAGHRRGAGRLRRHPRGAVRSPGVEPARPLARAGAGAGAARRARAWRSGVMAASTAMAAAGHRPGLLFYGGGYREPARKFAAAFPGFVPWCATSSGSTSSTS